MGDRVYTRSNKMDPSSKALAIDDLELLRKRQQCSVRVANISLSDPVLVHKAHSKHELAIVGIIDVWKDTQKEAGPETIQVLEKLPSLVPTGQLLCDVARRAIKRAWKVVETVSDGLAMLLPHFSSQYGPIPCRSVVWPCTINSAPPKADHQVRNVERAKMHNVRACGLR